ncbi:MAG: exodeoxyribonuclease VII small subunit [Thermoplasmata archaeon]
MENEKVKNKGFEEYMLELEEINNRLEREKVSLEETLDLYERGMKLIELCTKKLNEANGEIKKIIERESGEVIEDFEG